jgi:hydroxybutyrate-dimer hydrolase
LANGTRASAAAAGKTAAFNAGLSATELAEFNTATPNRFAFKHAHSGQNAEKNWGQNTLQAVEFAFYVINQKFGSVDALGNRYQSIKPSNTIVIASSLSNGGGAAIAAAEQDTGGLIDGVAVSEPAIEMPANPGVTVRRVATTVAVTSKTLVDFTTHANLYQACASLAPSVGTGPYAAAFAAGFAGAAACRGSQPLRRAASQRPAHGDHHGCAGRRSAAKTARLRLGARVQRVAPVAGRVRGVARRERDLCQWPVARQRERPPVRLQLRATAATGAVNSLAGPAALAGMFATGNGVPPSSGVQLVNNLGKSGAARDFLSFNAAAWPTGTWTARCACATWSPAPMQPRQKLQAGVNETRRNGNLRGKPTVIVHGRADALLPVNHTSRPYAALNRKVEGAASKLSYVEVTNAQHFDSFIGLPTVLPGYDSRYVPLHVYLNRALDAMYDHLKNGKALPASQVVRTVPRGGTPGQAPAITAANVPAAGDHARCRQCHCHHGGQPSSCLKTEPQPLPTPHRPAAMSC